MKHTILHNQWNTGWEYSSLNSFELAIQKITNANTNVYPELEIPKQILKHLSHGMNRSYLRQYLPKKNFSIECDVLWIVLMGPEDYQLDLFKEWVKSAKRKIVYLFDTLPHQYPTIKRLFSDNYIDICITSFSENLDELEKLTNRKWHYIPQAAPESFFDLVPFEERLIHFSSYGRRDESFHKVLIEYCNSNNLYYDYSTTNGKMITSTPLELYKQYGWHLSHSLFNISWPVNVTNPIRAGHLRPITARWFENAMAGVISIGKKPDNDQFESEFFKDLVYPIDRSLSKKDQFKALDQLMQNRETIFNTNIEHAKVHRDQWSWDKRVYSIIDILKKMD